MRFVSIASGSSGNCIYVGTDQTHILVDVGISAKRIEQGLFEVGLKPSELSAVCITHEHSDHIRGLGVLARKYQIPIYGTAGTLKEIKKIKSLGEYPEELFHPVLPDVDFAVGDLTVKPFHIDHDAADPVAYRIQTDLKAVAVATDLGVYTDYTIEHLKGLDVLLLEANHDIHMLQVGAYPYPLKQRISGELGHLSNETAGKLLCQVLHDDLKAVMLGHLSKENNYAELAYETVKLEIALGDTPYKPGDFPLSVAGREEASACIAV